MNHFKRCREMSGYTQKQVAISLKISVQAVSYWESGERKPSYETLLRLADLYRVSTDELLGRVPVSETEDHLTAEERYLVENYRQLNRQGREFIRQTVLTAVSAEIYKNTGDLSSVETA